MGGGSIPNKVRAREKGRYVRTDIEGRQNGLCLNQYHLVMHYINLPIKKSKKFSIGLREIKSAVYYARFQKGAW